MIGLEGKFKEGIGRQHWIKTQMKSLSDKGLPAIKSCNSALFAVANQDTENKVNTL